MNILAIDTTSNPLSLALKTGGRILRFERELSRPHDETLRPHLRRLLKRAGLGICDLDVLAAASGPGRFTGIRIGMAYAAVLAGQLKIPALAVSRLEALARKAPGKLVCAVIPGYRDEKYWQVFARTKSLEVRAVAAPTWGGCEAWSRTRDDLAARGAILAEGEVAARDLIPVAEYKLALRRLRFAPLYLKPASYEFKNKTGSAV